MSKKNAKTAKAAKTPKAKKPTAKQKAMAAITAAMETAPLPEAPAAPVEVTPETAPATEPEAPAAKAKGKTPKTSGKMSGLDAAAKVLAASTTPLTTKELVEVMVGEGLWTSKGATPAQTIYSAIIREIAKKGSAARFRKTERGHFTANA
ncbi:MAG TPA: winged helix-turn-helix domain-containing protein [Planctomycetota bacterium]